MGISLSVYLPPYRLVGALNLKHECVEVSSTVVRQCGVQSSGDAEYGRVVMRSTVEWV
ncbi:MAG: hypothetical protein AAF975_00245 [Spirochaetota bacterium]